MENTRSAFITRVNPAGCVNNLPDTLYRNQVSIGWEDIDPNNFIKDSQGYNWDSVKTEFKRAYPDATHGASSIFYFFSMKKGDLVLIPDPEETRELYLAIVNDEQTTISYNEKDKDNGRIFLRNIIWLNNKQPISYDNIPQKLKKHLTPQTVIDVSDFLPEIFEALLRETEARSLS